MWRQYYVLAKPGIVYGNSLSGIGGFFLASRGEIDILLGIAMVLGLGLVMASGCVINNYIDRSIDSHMRRTRNRGLVTGQIPPAAALLYGIILGAAGVGLLLFTTLPALLCAVAGWVIYVAVYGYWKRRSSLGTVIGSLAGAMPPVVGYTAAQGVLDSGAMLLFLILACWQMPHFYAIAIFRASEYKAASIPVLPVVKGIARTKFYMLLYAIAFVAAALLLSMFGYTGYSYLLIMSVVGVVWLARITRGFKAPDDIAWARSMFGFSLVVLLAFCTSISVDAWLP